MLGGVLMGFIWGTPSSGRIGCYFLIAMIWSSLAVKPLKAAEGAAGFYLLGSKTSMAGSCHRPAPMFKTSTFSILAAAMLRSISAASR